MPGSWAGPTLPRPKLLTPSSPHHKPHPPSPSAPGLSILQGGDPGLAQTHQTQGWAPHGVAGGLFCIMWGYLLAPLPQVGLAICYDLRFPEISLALAREGAEILTFPSAFTETTGAAHWEVRPAPLPGCTGAGQGLPTQFAPNGRSWAAALRAPHQPSCSPCFPSPLGQ